MLQAYDPNVDYTQYKALSRHFSEFNEDSEWLVSKYGWTKNELWWLIQVLEDLSGEKLSQLYKHLNPKDWQAQKESGFLKNLEDPVIIHYLYTFIMCTLENFNKKEAEKIIESFIEEKERKK